MKMTRADDGRGQRGAKGVSGDDTGRKHMAPAANLAEFRADPVGRCITGSAFVYGWPTPELCVTALWGTPGADDLEALAQLYVLELALPATPHASIIDTVRVDGVSQDAFGLLVKYVQTKRDALSQFVTRLAIVRRIGFVGAVASGFYETVKPPYPVEVFDDFASAIDWTDGPSWIEDELEQWVSRSTDVPDLLRELRRVLEARLPNAAVESVAKAMGLTVRTLQRRLKDHETTFRQEHGEAQVRVAQRWLGTTDEPISRIAYEVGCSTPQHLSTLFKQVTGETPSGWRDKKRLQ